MQNPLQGDNAQLSMDEIGRAKVLLVASELVLICRAGDRWLAEFQVLTTAESVWNRVE